jgi:hypothetical protein
MWCYRTAKGLQQPIALWKLLAARPKLEPRGQWGTTTAWRQGQDEATAARFLAELFP